MGERDKEANSAISSATSLAVPDFLSFQPQPPSSNIQFAVRSSNSARSILLPMALGKWIHCGVVNTYVWFKT